jgi:hypothetical protein
MGTLRSHEIRIELLEKFVTAIFECSLSLCPLSVSSDQNRAINHRLTLYPKNVGLQPVNTPLMPSALRITRNASMLLLYNCESTCRRHLTKSNGVTAVWVRPC